MRKPKKQKSDPVSDQVGMTGIPASDAEIEKLDEIGFKGGMDVKLSKIMDSGNTLETELSQHVRDELSTEIQNHERLCKQIIKWNRQYHGKKKPKSKPWSNCFSKDTEVLTSLGWKRVGEVGIGDRLYSINRETKQAYYVPVVSTTQTWANKLLRFSSKSVDLCVTADHKIAVQKKHDGKITFTEAENLIKENRLSGSRKSKASYKIPLCSEWSGKDRELIDGHDADLLMEFLGWYLSEGWTYKYGFLKKLSSIGIAQTKEIGRSRIKYVLDSLGFIYSENKSGFIVSAKNFSDNFRKLLASTGTSDKKYVPRQFLYYGKRNLESLLRGLLGGDGYVKKRDSRNEVTMLYYTTSRQLSDDVQEIAQKIGLRASIRKRVNIGVPVGIVGHPGVGRYDIYEVGILAKRQAKISSLDISRVVYNDVAYCFTLLENNTVFVRRNGIAQWCGQCSNVSDSLTRYGVDTILVRLLDAIFNRRKVIIVKALKAELNDSARKLEEALDWFQKHVLKLREKLLSPIIQQLKIGTGIVHINWESKKRTIYRYATPEELEDKSITTYPVEGTKSRLVKDVQTVYEGPQIFGVPREDFIASTDADTVEEAYLAGFRKSYRKYELSQKFRQGWRKEAAGKIIGPDQYTDNKEDKADTQDKELIKTPFSEPYTIWHLWLKYDCDGDGSPDDIILGYHMPSEKIVYCQYNPVFTGNRPFVKIVGYPKEYSFDGMGICEAVYQDQEQLDSIKNQRFDRMTLLNTYVTMTREGAFQEKFVWENGKNYVCTDQDMENAFRVIQGPPIYPDTYQIEDRTRANGEKSIGITPAVMGMQTAERPVAKVELSNVEEANKKFKSYIDNIRLAIQEIFYQILELWAQYQPTVRYKSEQGGEFKEETVEIPNLAAIREGLEIELAASTEMLSQETRREVNIVVFQMLSKYYSDLGTMAQAVTNPQVPPDFKKYVFAVDKASSKLLKDIMRDFDKNNPDELIVGLSDIINEQQALMPPMQPPGAPGEQGQPPESGLPPGMVGPPPGMDGPPPEMIPPGM